MKSLLLLVLFLWVILKITIQKLTIRQFLDQLINGVSYTVEQGETVAVVGESGSGKSVTAMSIMRLIPWPPGKIVGGSINFDGQEWW